VNNFENVGAVLQNCARIAAGRGALFTMNLVGTCRNFTTSPRDANRTGVFAKLEEHIQHRATAPKLEALLMGAGFAIREIATDSFRMRFADGSALLRHALIRFGFLPAWKAIVPDGAIAETFTALERNLNVAAAERGELALTIPWRAWKRSRHELSLLCIEEMYVGVSLAVSSIASPFSFERNFFGVFAVG
jgi:hypothetical protein